MNVARGYCSNINLYNLSTTISILTPNLDNTDHDVTNDFETLVVFTGVDGAGVDGAEVLGVVDKNDERTRTITGGATI